MVSRLVLIAVMASLASPARAQWGVDRGDSLSALFEYQAAIRAYHSDTLGSDYRRLSGLSNAENMLGLDVLAAGNRDSAVAHFERAIEAADQMAERYPDSASTYFYLAGAYGDLALLKGAKTKVRIGREVEQYGLHAIALDSTYSNALCVLGVFYREVAKLSWIERFVAKTLFGGLPPGSLEKSEDYLRRAVKYDPESAWARYELGKTLLEMKRPDEARRAYQELVQMKPQNGQDVRNIAEASEWLDKHPKG